MSTLREELNKYKETKTKIINESAVGWVKTNVILLNEKINRKDIERLVGTISQFQQTFEPCYEKVPSIRTSLQNVEDGLHKIVTGKRSNEKAIDMLKYMSFLYNTLSSFFKHDVDTLLKTAVFSLAKNNPDTPMKDLTNSRDMVLAFKTALKPDGGRAKLLKAIYKNSALPELDIDKICNELVNLTLNELKSLQKVDKVPVVVDNAAIQQINQAPAVEDKGPTVTTTESVSQLKESVVLLKEEILFEQYLNEAFDINAVKKITDTIQQLEGAVSGKGLPTIERALKQLKVSQANAVRDLANQNFFQQKFNKAGDFWNMLGKNDSEKGQTIGTIIKQAEMAIKTFEQLKTIIPELLPVFTGEALAPDKFNLFRQTLNGAMKGGILSKVAGLFGSKPYPGLEPDKFVRDIVALAQKEPAKVKETLEALSGVATTTAIPIQSASASPGQTGAPDAAKQTKPADATQPAGVPKGTFGAAGGSAAAATPEQLGAQLEKTSGVGGNAKQHTDYISKLLKAGWKVTPPAV